MIIGSLQSIPQKAIRTKPWPQCKKPSSWASAISLPSIPAPTSPTSAPTHASSNSSAAIESNARLESRSSPSAARIVHATSRPGQGGLSGFPRAVEGRRPRHSHPEGSQSGVCEAAIAVGIHVEHGRIRTSNLRLRYVVIIPVAVEKVGFREKSQKSVDRKCLGDSEKSFIELPDAEQFLRNRSERVFQQPPLFATPIVMSGRDCWHQMRYLHG